MVVIGGGVIGLEMGAVWSRLGAKVTVVEFLDRILPGMDTDCAKEMKKILEKKGIEFKLSTKVTSAKAGKTNVDLVLESASGEGKPEKMKADVVLVAVGRKAYTDKLGLADIGVEMDDRGRVVTGDCFDTNIDSIYAIGDVIAGPMLAHKAEDEGVVLAEMLAGQSGHIDYNLVPGVVYTYPEVASIGKTEEQLKESGVDYNVGKFPFMANGRARAMQATDGFVKILADKKTDKILGCHIIGAEAGTLIHEVAAVMEFGGSSEDLARTCHAHPTLSEIVKEAALDAFDKPLHM
jgi:dihydrolipoamide dehydrogenase